MASSSSPSPSPPGASAPTVPDEDHGVDLPMSMTASMILTHLPKDATQALADIESLDDRKGRPRQLLISALVLSTAFTTLTFSATPFPTSISGPSDSLL